MRVIEPYQFQTPLHKKRRPIRWLLLVLGICLVVAYTGLAYVKPLPTIQGEAAAVSLPAVAGQALQWPSSGQAAFGAVGWGALAESGAQTTAPIASVAKVVTALLVLRAKPLKIGQAGPLISMTEADVKSYNDYVARGGSVVPVNNGETLTEYQALQALLLPSANNMADSLVRWAYGSTDAFVTSANQYVNGLKLSQTHIADASGFSPQTISTPHDLVLLGIAALAQPVIAEIVGQKTASIPVAGTITNTNKLLGLNGVNGIKTGNTDEAGGCLLFSAEQSFADGQKITVVGAVMGASSLDRAQSDATSLLRSANASFQITNVLAKNSVVGVYRTPWGSTTKAVSISDIHMVVWAGAQPHEKVSLNDVKLPAARDTAVGTVAVESGGKTMAVPVVLQGRLLKPTLGWRFWHAVTY